MAEVLRIGQVFGVTLTTWRGRWEARFPGVALEVVAVADADQRRVLDEGSVDACFVRLPLDTTGLRVIRLYEEVTVAWASKDHGITLYDELTLADLEGEDIRSEVTDATLLEAVFGDALLLVPMSVARSHSRRDFVVVPVTDAPTTGIALAFRPEADGELLQEFIGIVRGRTVNSSRSTAQPKAAPRRQNTPRRAGAGRRPSPGRGRR